MTETIKTILTPIDGSEHAFRAARVAADMAEQMGVPLKLFHVFPLASYEIIGLTSLSREELENVSTSSGTRVFDKLREGLGRELPASTSEETAIGDPAEEILRIANDDPATLVVMGRRGLSRMKTLLLGSVSERVLRHAKGPVLVLSGDET